MSKNNNNNNNNKEFSSKNNSYLSSSSEEQNNQNLNSNTNNNNNNNDNNNHNNNNNNQNNNDNNSENPNNNSHHNDHDNSHHNDHDNSHHNNHDNNQTGNNPTDFFHQLNTEFNSANDPILQKNYEIHLDNLQKFRDDILIHNRIIQTHIENLITTLNEKLISFTTDTNSKINKITEKTTFLSDLISKTSYKLNKIDELMTFKKKSEDQLLSHEIKLTNTSNDLNNAIFKYDKIYIENLKVPGYIGSSLAPYKNMSEYVLNAIQNVTNLTNEKNVMKRTLNEYKIRQENMTREINTIISTSIQRCNDYTDNSKNLIEKKIELLKENIDENIMKVRMDNVKESMNLKEKSEKLISEWEIVMKIKEEIEKKLNEHLFIYKTDANEAFKKYEEMRKEFKHIKKRFGYLVEFIKDIRFRKNLDLITNRDPEKKIKKSDIKNLVGKIQFNKSELNEEIDDEESKKIDVDYDFFKGKDVSSDENEDFNKDFVYKKLNNDNNNNLNFNNNNLNFNNNILNCNNNNNNGNDEKNFERNKNKTKTTFFNVNNSKNNENNKNENNNNNNNKNNFVKRKMIRSKTLKVVKKMKSIKINNNNEINKIDKSDENKNGLKTERNKNENKKE